MMIIDSWTNVNIRLPVKKDLDKYDRVLVTDNIGVVLTSVYNIKSDKWQISGMRKVVAWTNLPFPYKQL